MKTFRWLAAILACHLFGALALADEAAEVLFVRRVQPLLHEKCLACHGGGESQEGGLDLRSLAGLLKGGDSEHPALVPLQPDQSPLYLAVARRHDDWSAMPPKQAERLTQEQVAWIRAWIDGGAPWPDETRTRELLQAHAGRWSAEDGVAVATSGGLTPEWTDRKYDPEALWAYRPVARPPIDAIGSAAIDVLVAAAMPEGLAAAPPADRITLIRRATFGLTGLPPAPHAIEAFVQDAAPDAEAFAKVVERLLASPHYGERMAQHWLDVVRYADSSGLSNDYERGNAWRYRSYVVRAFNNDKPYDQFILEQIAGDEIDPANPEMLIATGFLRMGPWELTGMEVAKVARQRFLDDVTSSVGEAFLAHSLQCARCHDHKFDPVPTRDYYAVQAVFATTQLAEREADFLRPENLAGFDERRFLELSREEHLETLRALDEVLLNNADRWFQETAADPAKWQAAVAEARQRAQGPGRNEFLDVFSAARNSLARQGVPESDYPPKLVGFTPQQFGRQRVADKGLQRLRWELERYEPFALAVYSGRTPDVKGVYAPTRMPGDRLTAGQREDTCILIGGDPFSPSAPVRPGVLSVLGAVQKTPIPHALEGRRKAFAQWVASADNPLTTRTITNRVWLWHFDQPIAGNPNNFGASGKRPTHPELLDWLAATFVEQGWSFKAMHRLILNSETYRRGSEHPDRRRLTALDPLGTSYAVFRPRRLSAEELRDAMLAATGELNPMLGGIPNRPEIHFEAALQPRQVMGTFAAAWVPNPLPGQRHRRSIYALKLRGLVDPMLEVFNAPVPDFSCERREASTVTPQALSLFNSQASHRRALALAARVLKETASDEEAVARCFLLCYGRAARPGELSDCLSHWREMETLQAGAPRTVPPPPLEVRRDAIEENTGERFSYTEKLPAYAEFVPDLQPAGVDARTRALAGVCLALFNSNEFAHVY